MYFEPNDGLIFGEDFGRECEGCGHQLDFTNGTAWADAIPASQVRAT
jgi:hypothetical protein